MICLWLIGCVILKQLHLVKQDIPLPVELVGLALVYLPELLLEVRGQVDGGVEVLPDEGVVLNIPVDHVLPVDSLYSNHLLDKVLLSNVARSKVSYTVHRYYPYILYSPQKVLEKILFEFLYCHTWLHLGFLAKLRIWLVPACKKEPRSDFIIILVVISLCSSCYNQTYST